MINLEYDKYGYVSFLIFFSQTKKINFYYWIYHREFSLLKINEIKNEIYIRERVFGFKLDSKKYLNI
jgi:hypothetical protein